MRGKTGYGGLHGDPLRKIFNEMIPKDWIDQPGKFRTPWDFAEHLKLHEAETLQGLPLSKLRERLFPRLAARRISSPHSQVRGFDSPAELATMLLFFDSVIVEICPRCLTQESLRNATILLDKGLAVPLLVTSFSTFRGKSLDLLQTYQESIVSSWANEAYALAATRGSKKDRGQENGKLLDQLRSIEVTSRNMPAPFKAAVHGALVEFDTPFSPLLTPVVGELVKAVNKMDLAGIWKCSMRASAILSLERDRIYSTTPTFPLQQYKEYEPTIAKLFPAIKPTYAEALDLCAKGLHVAWTPDLPLQEYVEITSSYRGKLRHLFSPLGDPMKAVESAMNTVSALNTELEEISRSRRYRWGVVSMNILKMPSVIGLLSRVALGWSHGIDSVISAVAQTQLPSPSSDLESSGLTRDQSTSDRVLARYLGRNIRLVQLWRLRRRLYNAKKRRDAFAKIASLND